MLNELPTHLYQPRRFSKIQDEEKSHDLGYDKNYEDLIEHFEFISKFLKKFMFLSFFLKKVRNKDNSVHFFETKEVCMQQNIQS